MKKLYATIALALMAMTSFAQEQNDTTYVMLDFNQNPWNYPVREVTSGWQPDAKDWDAPGAILDNTDFSWPLSEGSSEKVKVTLYAVDLDEYNKVSVYGQVEINEAEAASFGISAGKINVLYTQPGTTMRFEAPEGYQFGKMVFYNFHSPNFMVGDEYDELFEYEYNNSLFNQKLKVWTPASPKISQYDMNIWEGDERNILFCYPYFNAHFVKIDMRLVPNGSSGISEVTTPRERVNVYSINGVVLRRDRLRRDALNGLRPGLYIVDGRKVVVK